VELRLQLDDQTIVRISCEGDISQMDFSRDNDPLEALLRPLGGFARKVLLDLEKTTFIDSSGISWLLVTHKHFLQGGGRLVLHSIPPRVNQVMQLVRLPLIMQLAPNETAARALALGEKQ
jgi:anti-anti-sigma factor